MVARWCSLFSRPLPAFTAVFALAACGGGSTGAHAGSTSSIDPQTTVSEPAAQPDKLTGPAAGRSRRAPAHRFHLTVGQCQLHDRRGLGPLRHHRPRLVATRAARGLRAGLRARDLARTRRAGSLCLRGRHRLRRGRGAAVRRVDHRRGAAVRKCRVGRHVPRSGNRLRVLDFTARRISCSDLAGSEDRRDLCGYTLVDYRRPSRRATCRSWRADVAQLVAHHLAKVRVAGSNPVIRSKVQWHQPQRWSGRVVRQRPAKPCTRVRFPSPPPRRIPRD